MATSKSNELLELPIFPLIITVLNVNGKGNGFAPLRRTYFADVIKDHEPDILLVQEFQWKGIEGRIWKDAPIPDWYIYNGNREASILNDEERFDLKELAQTKLERPLEELKRMNKVSQDFTPLSRSTIRLLESHGSTSIKAFKILVSWHGVHKCTTKYKILQFEYLLIYLKELSEREKAAVLLGGDFNISIDSIRGIDVSPNSLRYEPFERRINIKTDSNPDTVSPEFILYEYSSSA